MLVLSKARRGVAQLVEHRIPNPTVPGSSPGAPAIFLYISNI